MNKPNIINGLFDAIESNLNNNLLLLEEINNSQLDQIDEIKNMIDDLIKDLFENFDLDIIDNSMEKNVEPITDAIKEFFIIQADNNSLEEIKESKIEESSNRIPVFEEQKYLGKTIPNFPNDSNEKNKKSSNACSPEKEITPFIKERNINSSEEKNDVIKVSILSDEKYNNNHEISFSVNQSLEIKKQNDFILKEDSPLKEFGMAKTSNSPSPSKNNRPCLEKEPFFSMETHQIKTILDEEKNNQISEKNDIIIKNSPKKQQDEDLLNKKESIKSENSSKMDNEFQNVKSLKDFDKKSSNKIKNYNVYYSKSSNSKAIEELIKNTKLPEIPDINTINNNNKDKKPKDKKTSQKESNKSSNKISNSIEKKNEKSEIKKEKDKNEKVDLKVENDKPMNENNLNSNNKNLSKKTDKNNFLLSEFNFENKKNEAEKKEKKLESEKKEETKISNNISQSKNEKSSERIDFPKNRKILSSFDFPSERKDEKQGEYSSCEKNFKSNNDSTANRKQEKNSSNNKDNTISEFTKIKKNIVNDDIISMPKETFSVQEDEGLSQELNTSKKNKEEINEKLFPKKFNSENKLPGDPKKKKLLNYYYFFDEKKESK